MWHGVGLGVGRGRRRSMRIGKEGEGGGSSVGGAPSHHLGGDETEKEEQRRGRRKGEERRVEKCWNGSRLVLRCSRKSTAVGMYHLISKKYISIS